MRPDLLANRAILEPLRLQASCSAFGPLAQTNRTPALAGGGYPEDAIRAEPPASSTLYCRRALTASMVKHLPNGL